jgi:hypothetical protein
MTLSCKIRELVIPMVDISRRTIIKATGAVGATMLPLADAPRKASAEGHQGHPDGHEHPTHSDVPSASGSQQGTTYLFLGTEEAAFIEAAVALAGRRAIPAPI